MNSEKEIIKHIWNRTSEERNMISLEKILKSYQMEAYLMSCGRRISESELIDGKHTMVNFSNIPDLLFDSDGLMICFDILSGYVEEDEIRKLYEYAKSREEKESSVNGFLETLRNGKIKMLISVGFFLWKENGKAKKYGSDNAIPEKDAKRISKFCRMELFSRNPINRLRIFISDKAIGLYIKLRFWKLISSIKALSKECTTK